MRCDDDRMSGPVVRPIPAALLALTIALAIASVPVSFGHELLIDTVLYPLNGVAFAVAGALIASRWRGSSIGWVLLGVGVVTAFGEAVEGYGYHDGYPAAVTAEWIATWINFVEIGATAIILTLLPSGRVLSARWRPVLWAGIAATGLLVVSSAFGHSTDSSFRSGRNPYAVDSPVVGVLYVVGQVLFLAALLASIVSLVARFRRSSGVERQQLKWIAYAVTALAVMAPIAIFFYYDSVLVQVAIAPVVTALPAAICIAIMRYRLYDIDVIVNRTVVYGSLTILLAGGYVGVSLALGAAFGGLHSSWVTAGATLAAALAFGPLRRWIQDAVDRRFRRARYAALGRVDAFLADLRGGRVVPERLEDLLREVLNRPDLELRYVLPDATTYIDAHGAEVSQDDGGRLHTRVERAGVLLAVVSHVEDLDSIDAARRPTLDEGGARPRRPRDRDRATTGRGPPSARGGHSVEGTNHRRRLRGASPTRAGPARRRPAAPGQHRPRTSPRPASTGQLTGQRHDRGRGRPDQRRHHRPARVGQRRSSRSTRPGSQRRAARPGEPDVAAGEPDGRPPNGSRPRSKRPHTSSPARP